MEQRAEINYNNIPEELKSQKAWVNVFGSSKIPMQTGFIKAASSVVPETWGNFTAAVENVSKGVYDGIGYVFHDTGLVGIDIDAGFDGLFLSKLSVDIMVACRSYTEKSRSGRGIHILLKGDLPFKGRNNRNGVEIYKSSRYFIMTGDTLVYDKIEHNQNAIDYVVSKYFPETLVEKEKGISQTIYRPFYDKPTDGLIPLQPTYPTIPQGMRNISLTSLAGQLHNADYPKDLIFEELKICNEVACQPPLSLRELRQIVNSVTRYAR